MSLPAYVDDTELYIYYNHSGPIKLPYTVFSQVAVDVDLIDDKDSR